MPVPRLADTHALRATIKLTTAAQKQMAGMMISAAEDKPVSIVALSSREAGHFVDPFGG
jgi:hypothetical protein